MRILLDTNVLVSAVHFASSNPRKALNMVLRGEHRLVTSPHLLREFEEVLVEVCKWEPAQARAARLQVEDLADVVTPGERPAVSRDPDDDEVLAVASFAHVHVVVTGDKDLLVLRRHGNAPILNPRDFLGYSDQAGRSAGVRDEAEEEDP